MGNCAGIKEKVKDFKDKSHGQINYKNMMFIYLPA